MVAIQPHSPLISPSDLGTSNRLFGQQPLPFQDQAIRPGDTLTDIARRHDTTVQALMEMNPQIKDPDLIRAGDTIRVPGNRSGLASMGNQEGVMIASNQAMASPETRFPSGFETNEIASNTLHDTRGYDPVAGQRLADDAEREARSRGTVGSCYNAVADVIDRQSGKFLTGRHAYMAADQLAARKDLFREVPAQDLSRLPAGAVVVWGQGNSESGHISIALGDGREASDHVDRQMQRHYGGASARVFLPIR